MMQSGSMVHEYNGTAIHDLCAENRHDMCRKERGEGSYRDESGSRNWADAHDSAWCQCPCHDKRTKQYKILFAKFKMNVIKYLNAGNFGIKDIHGYTPERRIEYRKLQKVKDVK